MNSIIAVLKRVTPWWGKIAIKIVLARMPIPYRLWKSLSLFEHGDMESPEYVLSVVNARLSDAGLGTDLSGKVCLELGPGDSLASAVVAKAYGAKRTFLVDVGPFATRDVAIYNAMADFLESNGIPACPNGGFRSFEHMLEYCNATYLTEGLASMARIPTAYIDFEWSNAVFEHIRRYDFADVMIELNRVTKLDGVGAHGVDLSDHLGGALNNLCFREGLWESAFFANSGFYTNRIQFTPMIDMCRGAGFDAQSVITCQWDSLPTPRERMVEPFRSHPTEDLLVRDFNLILRPKSR